MLCPFARAHGLLCNGMDKFTAAAGGLTKRRARAEPDVGVFKHTRATAPVVTNYISVVTCFHPIDDSVSAHRVCDRQGGYKTYKKENVSQASTPFTLHFLTEAVSQSGPWTHSYTMMRGKDSGFMNL